MILFEEKDKLHDEYGVIRAANEADLNIDPQAIVGRRATSYCTDLMVKKALVDSKLNILPVSIEDLFVFMIKGGRV